MVENFIYAVACIRAKENSLFTKKDIDFLTECKSYEDCLRYLQDKGWGDAKSIGSDVDGLLASESEKTWNTVYELTDDLEPFNVFRYANDFHNLKAAVKCIVTDTEPDGVYVCGGTVNPDDIYKYVKERETENLPQHLKDVADKAYVTLIQTYDGQLCDIMIDNACLSKMHELGNAAHNPIVREYAELTVAAADIKTAVRCCKTNKKPDFIKQALVPCNTLNIESLSEASAKSLDDIKAVLHDTPYAEAMDILMESSTGFEKWFDDRMMEKMRTQKWEPFTVGPLVAYIFARETEIKAVRIILSGKLNDLDNDVIKERLREMYV